MAAYPLIDDDDQLVALDGWLVNLLDVAMQKRVARVTRRAASFHGPRRTGRSAPYGSLY